MRFPIIDNVVYLVCWRSLKKTLPQVGRKMFLGIPSRGWPKHKSSFTPVPWPVHTLLSLSLKDCHLTPISFIHYHALSYAFQSSLSGIISLPSVSPILSSWPNHLGMLRFFPSPLLIYNSPSIYKHYFHHSFCLYYGHLASIKQTISTAWILDLTSPPRPRSSLICCWDYYAIPKCPHYFHAYCLSSYLPLIISPLTLQLSCSYLPIMEARYINSPTSSITCSFNLIIHCSRTSILTLFWIWKIKYFSSSQIPLSILTFLITNY